MMWVKSVDHNISVNLDSIEMLSVSKESKADNVVDSYLVLASLRSGKNLVLARFATEEGALLCIKNIIERSRDHNEPIR